jgi:hypothetical protein
VDGVSYYLSCNCFRSKSDYQTLEDLRPVKRLGFSVLKYWGPKVDAIAYYRDKVKKVNRVIKAHLRYARGRSHRTRSRVRALNE